MGSNPSSIGKKHQDTSQYGQIYLQTNKATYNAGDTVTGTIHLNLISYYPGNQLFLKLKGKEVVHFALRDQNGQNPKKYSDNNQIIKLVILVHTWETLTPCQLTIPFSFYLSHHLPPSFYQQGFGYLAFTEYKLEAFIQPHKDKDPKMKYKQPLVIRQNMPENNPKYLPSLVTKELETCCCCCSCKQGSTTLKVDFEKNYYYPEDTARVKVELNNSETKLTNDDIIFILNQTLNLRAQGKLFSVEIPKKKQILPGVPEQFKTNSGTIELILPRPAHESDFQKIDTKNLKLFNLINSPEKFDVVTPTPQGELINSTYFFEVAARMTGYCSVGPRTQFSVSILSPDFQLPVVSAPDNWNPIILESINLIFPLDDDDESNKPLLSGQGGNMLEVKVAGNSSQKGVEMV